MTRNITIAAVACGLLALPASALAADEPSPDNFKNAAKYCKALKKAAGEDNFKAMFGGKKNAYGKCVSKAARRDAKQEDQAHASAAKQCKAEQAMSDEDFKAAHGGKTFAELYGTNKNGKNAYGKCVSQHAKQDKAEADAKEQENVSSAKECRTEQKADPAAFAQKYGKNDNDRNAFGKCVSQKSHEHEQGQQGGGAQ
ncbi:MAG TPA: hypothetical protein VF520_06650 [Thermoleophilaceae bacterium]|jgi:hypothetical protein